MSDPSIPLALLAQFHREVIIPDIERIVGGAERRLRDEMHGLHDAVLTRLDRLEFEYQAIRAVLVRIEERLERMEHRGLGAMLQRVDERLSRVERRLDALVAADGELPTRTEVEELRARLDGLQAQVDALARRLEP